MAGGNQPFRKLPFATDRIATDAGNGIAFAETIVQNDRNAAPGKLAQLFGCQSGRDDRAIDAVSPNLIEHRIDFAFGLERKEQDTNPPVRQPACQLRENFRIIKIG